MVQRNRWWLVGAVGLVVFMVQLDATIVSVALPVLQADLHTGPSVIEWVILGHLLPIIALVLPSGRWLDSTDKRAVLALSTGGFALTSALAGAAPAIGWLIAARVAQGVFGAVLLALTPALSTIAVRPEARGRAMGIVTTLGPLGAVTGPALGGFLVEHLGWPWIFYVNVPVSLIVIAVGLRQLEPDGRFRLPDSSWAVEALALSTGLVALFVGLSLAASHGPGWSALALLAVPPLLAWRRLETSQAVRRVMQVPGMVGPHVALLGLFIATGFVQFLAPFFLQQVLGVSASTTGLIILAFPVAMAVLGTLSGALADAWGSRRAAVAGAVVTTAGLALLAPLGGSLTAAELAWRLAIVGVGVGLFNAPNMTTAMSSAPRHLLGTTAASTSLARQLGLALGPAIATALWALSDYGASGMRGGIVVAAVLSAATVVVLARDVRVDRGDETSVARLTPTTDRRAQEAASTTP